MNGTFNILEIKNNFPSQDVFLLGDNGNRMLLHAFPKIDKTEDMVRLNETGPILLRRRVVVHQTRQLSYISKDILTCLIAHGINTNGQHVLVGGIPSYEFYTKTSEWLLKNKLPKVEFFASCDNRSPSGLTTRWDQFSSNPVIGIAAITNFTRLEGSNFVVDMYMDTNPSIDPFSNRSGHHPKRRLVEEKFSQQS